MSEVLSDRVPGGQGWPIEGFHLLSRGLLQVRYMRHQADPEDLLQQPAHDQRQGGVLQQPRPETGAGNVGRVQRGHQVRVERAEKWLRERADQSRRRVATGCLSALVRNFPQRLLSPNLLYRIQNESIARVNG